MAIHQELHETLEPVPVISDLDARFLWIEYCQVMHRMSLFEALEWLQLHAPDDEFREAIFNQSEFLRTHLDRL